MKKTLTLLLALALVLTALVGCSALDTQDESSDTAPTIADEYYDEIIGGDTPGNQDETKAPEESKPDGNEPESSDPTADDEPEAGVPQNSQVAAGFLAKQKKYNYGEKNIVMLNVTNQNTDNYSVKVEGYYLDADGNILKTETKFVEGYEAGYVKDFLFNPRIAFDSFKFTLTAEKFSGECYEDDFYLTDLSLKQTTAGGFTPEEQAAGFEVLGQYPCLYMWYGSIGYTGTVYPARFAMSYIIINSYGDVHLILDRSNMNANLGWLEPQPEAVDSGFWKLYLSFTEEDLWPEDLKDGYQILWAFDTIEK